MACGILNGSLKISRILNNTIDVKKVYSGNTLIWPCYSYTYPTDISYYYLTRTGSTTIVGKHKNTYPIAFTSGVTYWIEYDLYPTISTSLSDVSMLYTFSPAVSGLPDSAISELKNSINLEVYDEDGTTLLDSLYPITTFNWEETFTQGSSVPTKRYFKIEYNYQFADYYFTFIHFSTYSQTSSYSGRIASISTGPFTYEPIDGIYKPSSTYETLYMYPSSGIIGVEGGVMYIKCEVDGTGIFINNTYSFDIRVEVISSGGTVISTQVVAANSESAISFGTYKMAHVYVYPYNTTDSINTIQIKDTV